MFCLECISFKNEVAEAGRGWNPVGHINLKIRNPKSLWVGSVLKTFGYLIKITSR